MRTTLKQMFEAYVSNSNKMIKFGSANARRFAKGSFNH